MLRTERPDFRRSKETELLDGLRSRDPLALAEAYHRTSPAAHACARRLLGGARDAEALLTAVYAELWASPPETARLEGWVRSRCFRLAAEHLRERDEPPASPSLALLLPDLPRAEQKPYDPLEQALAALPERERRAVLLAHDQGMPTAAQDDPDAEAALDRALMALAGPGEGVNDGTGRGCEDLPGMADWTLGLLEADRAARVSAEVIDNPACAARSRALRRGRRRLEGLPPAPDMGQRVVASVLAGTPAAAPGAETPPVVDIPSTPDDGALGVVEARSILDEGPTSSPVSPPPSTPPPSTPPPSTPPPSTPAPAAFPESLIPFAPLPSSLDEEEATPPEPREDELAFLSPERLSPEPGSPERERPDDASDGEDAVDAATDREVPPTGERSPPDEDAREDAREVISTEERARDREHEAQEDESLAPVAEAPEEAPPPTQESEAPGVGAGTAGDRQLGRQLLNVLAIVVVLALGGALGLAIGFMLVR